MVPVLVAGRRAICLDLGETLTKHIDSIIQRAERKADAIRREAERDAEDIRRDALESAQRLLDRLLALEFPLGSLVAGLREETEEVARQLDASGEPSRPSASNPVPGGESPHGGVSDREAASADVSRRARRSPQREPQGWQRWVPDEAD